MDVKVKAMIKLIEEDADSFARRAEMYYKKRPELMKLVEEFYLAYRALAERYDHVTGELRQAHQTMAKAFPNQVPFMLSDDSPLGSSTTTTTTTTESKPHKPETPPPPICSLFDSAPSKKGLTQLNEMFAPVEVDYQANNAETEFETLTESLTRLQVKKESGLVRHQECLNRISNLEAEILHSQEDVAGFNERASKAETRDTTTESKLHKPETPPPPICSLFDSAPSKKGLTQLNEMFAPVEVDYEANNAETEVETLKESLTRLQVKRESSLVRHQEYLDRISNLEAEILHSQEDAVGFNERASKAEIEVHTLKQVLTVVEVEKEVGIHLYNQCLETISNLERKILQAEEDARRLNEQADKAERKVETLKQALTEVNEEKEAAALRYQHCLKTISKLETEICHAQDEAKRLNGEIQMGVAKLNSAEEQCFLLERSNQSLRSEVEALMQKVGTQNQELSEKQQESRRLLIRMQEEHLHFMQAEAAIQTLQNLHSQSQEVQRALALKHQNRFQMLTDMELHNWGSEREIQEVEEENKNPNQLTLSAAVATPSASISPSQPVFGNPSPVVAFGSASPANYQMNMKDSMVEDTVQTSIPAVPAFGQPIASPPSSNIFDSPTPSGMPSFQFGSNNHTRRYVRTVRHRRRS